MKSTYSSYLFRTALFVLLLSPAILFIFTLGRYYGYYYDNKFFNLLALTLLEDFRPYLYLGSHYHVPSSLYSYLSYLIMLFLGPGDVAVEIPAAISHLATAYLCYRLGSRYLGKPTGAAFAVFVAWAPIHLVQVYTMPDLSLAIFLNVAAIYLFLVGLETRSIPKIAVSALIFSIGSFQAVYSLLLLPFYLMFALAFMLRSDDRSLCANGNGNLAKFVVAAWFVLALPAYSYLYLLLRATYLSHSGAALIFISALLLAFFLLMQRSQIASRRFFLPAVFFGVTAALLSYFDLIVQFDYYFFDHTLGYYIDADVAGGYGGRPLVHFMGREVSLFGIPVRMSVLTSMFEFVGKDFARLSAVNVEGLSRLYWAYFVKSFPPQVRLLFVVGVVGSVWHVVHFLRSGQRSALFSLFPVFWLAAILNPFIDLGPDYFNIRRIYILPMPYLIAAIGAVVVSSLAGKVFEKSRTPVLIAIIALATLAQVQFTAENIFSKALHDKKAGIYFKLFYGHYYGRSYQETGAFLLKDAPMKENGIYRAALIYTIPEDSLNGRSLPLFNTINWYTQNKIAIHYAFKKRSAELYGSKDRLANYIDCLFEESPELQVIYFADFVDDANNYAYFSKVHTDIRPYAIVDDDGSSAFDSLLYRFDRVGWGKAVGAAASIPAGPARL